MVDERPVYPEHERKLPRLTAEQLRQTTDEEGRVHFYMPDSNRRVCGRLKRQANRKIPGEACLGPPMSNGACRVHGGKAGRPIKTGRYSKKLKRWRRDFVQALTDKDLLDPRPELALMDVAIAQYVERAEEHDSSEWRVELKQTYTRLQAAIKASRRSEVNRLMQHLGELIGNGAAANQALGELMEHVDRRANRAHKVNELELRREERVTATEFNVLIMTVVQVLKDQLDGAQMYTVLGELKKTEAGRFLPPVGSAEALELKEGASVPLLIDGGDE